MPQLTLLTPIGELTLSECEDAIVSLDWGRGRDQTGTPLLHRAASQLQEYFDGTRQTFDLPLVMLDGSKFQQQVWKALRDIPIGHCLSYGELARRIGGSARAIGQAAGANPIPIIIPCHRVLGGNGAIGGYSGGDGPATKRWLLDHERRSFGSAAINPELPLGPTRTSLQGTMPR